MPRRVPLPVTFVVASMALFAGCGGSEPPPPPAPKAPPEPEPTPVDPSTITQLAASSELEDKGVLYSVRHLVDGDPGTAWCEGAAGLVGESWTVGFAEPITPARITVQGGWFKNDRVLTGNGRITRFKVEADTGWSREVRVPRIPQRTHRVKDVKPIDTRVPDPQPFQSLTFTILAADPGASSEDVCVSGMGLFVK